jgi:hypothetical protein
LTYSMIKSEWNDFFVGSPTHEHKGSLSRFSLSSGGAYVNNALFQNLGGSSNGGAIYCSSVSVNVLIEETLFIYCTTSEYGGALYLQISGECIISKVCGTRCITTSQYCHFSYISVTAYYDKRNSFLHSSVCNSVSGPRYTVEHSYGKVLFEFANFSSNKCLSETSILSLHQSTAKNTEIGFNARYSSITNNTATGRICFNVHNSGTSCLKQIDSCNFINNTDTHRSYGLINTKGKLIIKDSTILGNKGNYQVYEESGPYGSIILNCTIDFTSSSVTSGVTIISSPSTSFLNKIPCLLTGECKSSYDSFGELTVIPDQTNIKRKKITCDSNNASINSKMIAKLIILIFSYLS